MKKKQKDAEGFLEVKERVEKNNAFSPGGTADFKVSSGREKLFIQEMF